VMNIGLTGGIATGKSTVAASLVRRGARLVDADQIAREVVLPGSPTLAEVALRFGQDILQEDGTLDRKKLGSIVFADSARRKELESILHPAIRAIMRERMHQYETETPERLVVVDIPLLYESGLEHMVSEVMVVYVPRELQLKRLMERDKLNSEQAEIRLNAQMDIESKKMRADHVIDNSGTLEQTEQQLDRFWREKAKR